MSISSSSHELAVKIDEKYQQVVSDPNHEFTSELSTLRHALWKRKHCNKRRVVSHPVRHSRSRPAAGSAAARTSTHADRHASDDSEPSESDPGSPTPQGRAGSPRGGYTPGVSVWHKPRQEASQRYLPRSGSMTSQYQNPQQPHAHTASAAHGSSALMQRESLQGPGSGGGLSGSGHSSAGVEYGRVTLEETQLPAAPLRFRSAAGGHHLPSRASDDPHSQHQDLYPHQQQPSSDAMQQQQQQQERVHSSVPDMSLQTLSAGRHTPHSQPGGSMPFSHHPSSSRHPPSLDWAQHPATSELRTEEHHQPVDRSLQPSMTLQCREQQQQRLPQPSHLTQMYPQQQQQRQQQQQQQQKQRQQRPLSASLDGSLTSFMSGNEAPPCAF
ncbi:MAG: hypothetical protein WDW36_004797 [Sanguina aurantia]